MSGPVTQSVTIARAACRELIWGLPAVSSEVAHWRARAAAIPDPALRADALRALERKRGNIDGAALFWTLPKRRNSDLLRALVAWEIIADYLDCVSERYAHQGIANGRHLHRALVDALQPSERVAGDYYVHNPARTDNGYLQALVSSCRSSCSMLPAFQVSSPHLVRAATLASEVLALNHEPDPRRRDAGLRSWASVTLPHPATQTWFERTAGASSWLTVHALLAHAAQPALAAPSWAASAGTTYDAYLRWISPVGAMLDAYGDLDEDQAQAQHSYIAHYPDLDVGVERVSSLIRESLRAARSLPAGATHEVIAASMIAFYLSKDTCLAKGTRASKRGDSACARVRAHTRALVDAGGPLTRALLPVLRSWRIAYKQRLA